MLCRSVSNSQRSRWCAVIYYFTSKDEDNEKARALFVSACAVSCAEIKWSLESLVLRLLSTGACRPSFSRFCLRSTFDQLLGRVFGLHFSTMQASYSSLLAIAWTWTQILMLNYWSGSIMLGASGIWHGAHLLAVSAGSATDPLDVDTRQTAFRKVVESLPLGAKS